jgi:hypothetical protein
MVRRGIAIGFTRIAEPGRTKPLRATVLTDDGAEYEVVMKVSSGIELGVESLMNEMLGSLIAADLGLSVQEPLFVILDPEFCASIPSNEIRARLVASSPLAFASVDAGKQWRGWNASDKVSPSQEATALAAMAFDAFIGNSDRSPGNPNLLVKDQAWRLIDHESGFSFRLKLFPRCQPWVVGNLSPMIEAGARGEHVFSGHLLGRASLSFDPIKASWTALSDARLAQYDAILPEEWAAARPQLTDAIAHLRTIRDTIDLCLTELQRILT